MSDVVAPVATVTTNKASFISRVRTAAHPLSDWFVAFISALLLVLAFPDFEVWPLAAVGLVPLLVVIGKRPRPLRSFFLGWLTGTVFFYGTCYWLTYSMIHYGGIPAVLGYLFLIPVTLVVGLFPGIFAFILAIVVRRWGVAAFLFAAFVWPATEWARLGVTGQLWNALGYSLAYHAALIQPAGWGGVYAVSFSLVAINSVIAFVLLRRTTRAVAVGIALIVVVVAVTLFSKSLSGRIPTNSDFVGVNVIALQPNVPMDLVKSNAEMNALTDRHVKMTEAALNSLPQLEMTRLVIWPESPMNFTYGTDSQLRELLVNFATKHHTSVLFNSQEAAPNDGIYNSALFVNEQGQLIAQYDKIRLMPFGEYVPLPRWMPGANLITAIVGDFTPGTRFTLMPVGEVRAGVFICIESAYPFVARGLTREGADVLINISNDGYLGPTAVRRQHLANAIFRAVENEREILRVTNTGITAHISEHGEVLDATESFQPAVRTWSIGKRVGTQTFYGKYGDVFVAGCAVLSLILLVSTFGFRKDRVKEGE
ncbi:MAG TPA: apolipoprotein N-acyltransferase [Pyrinomonadaceae bacterium]|nr:apolipoprotein N-acyltransferase [Pyrinomonadaceae bacterium]